MTISEAAVRAESNVEDFLLNLEQKVGRAREAGPSRVDQAAWLILIPIAVVIALGLMTAWFMYCQQRGAWPAVDMPSFTSGGTWKVYCSK